MNILITGGAGFIGSHIADAYIAAGHRVVIVDNLSTGEKQFIPEKAEFHQADISSVDWPALLKENGIHVINHHAAQISISKSVRDPHQDAKSNILGTLQILQSAVSYGVEKFVFASTGGALYGETNGISAAEDHACNPLSPYAISKYSVEHYLGFFRRETSLKCVSLRYSNVYGPRQNPHGEAGVVAIHCNRMLSQQPPIIFGNGEQTRDFIYVDDVAQANLIALKPECSGTYNIGTGLETSVKILTDNLVAVSGLSTEIEFHPAKPGEQKRSSICSDKFSAEFGWAPQVPIEKGLVKTFDYFKKQIS